ncbi:MAG TPA: AI-2E family transporter [Kofleriaceae bacterium]|nr:AI-2E family transporter [Kofleriaceae bacterium]
MSQPPSPSQRGIRLLVAAACLVIVVAGLRAGQAFFLPMLMAGFLTILCIPPLRWMRRLGLPEWASVLLVISGAILTVLGVVVVVGGTIQSFYQELPTYRARLDGMVQTALAWLQSQGIDIQAEELSAKINTGAIMDLTGSTAASIVSAFSSVVLVLLLMAFMLFEVSGGPQKLRRALGESGAGLESLRRGAEQVQRYLAIKTAMSLLNAAAAIGVCVALDVDYPLLWGLFAFLFNYVPNIGSILAGIPPVLLALVDHGPARAALVAALYMVIDVLSGNVLEPKVMGNRLGLSPLVVMVSLVFWGWLWGPVGMLLSVPLTSVAKIMIEQRSELRWLAVLLGSEDDPEPAEPRGDTMRPA